MSKNQSKFLNKLKPWLSLIPQVEAPTQKVALRERLMWTLGVLVIFLVASQTPLYGVRPSESGDPLYWFRAMLASNRGSLMELGISPIVTSSLVMQLLAGSKLFHIDQTNEEQKNLFQGAQKLFGILITIGEAVAYVLSGMYGSVPDLGFGNVVLIILQLFLAGILVMMLDETLQRGHGIGSGISLFIATNICEQIIWNTLSPTSIDTGAGVQYEGALIALFHLLLSRRNRIAALKEAFYRPGLPNLSNLIATVVVFVVVIFFQGFRVDLSVKNQRSRNNQGFKYPIKLFYTSNIPIILQTALVSNVYFLSQVLSNRFGSNIVTNLLGSWKVVRGVSVPIGGLVYYISPPRTLYEVLTDPIHAMVYFAFILITCALFSVTWIEVSGSSPRDVAKQFKDQGLVIRGHRENSTVAVLERYIPIASAFGGMCIGALTVFADFMGAIGSGTGILLAVTIIFEIFETYVQEAQKEGLNLGIPGLQI